MLEIEDRRQITNTDIAQNKYNPGKANYAKHGETKLSCFSCFLRHLARKWGELILLRSRAHTGWGSQLLGCSGCCFHQYSWNFFLVQSSIVWRELFGNDSLGTASERNTWFNCSGERAAGI